MTLTATDLALFQTINGYAGDYVLDRMAVNIESNHLIKGGIIVILLWYYWFAANNRQDERRQIVVCAVIGALLALVINRTLATFLPFRVRPMYTDGIGFHPLSIDYFVRLENWSSFPSDNATFFFALSTGIYFLSRPLGILAGLYSVIVAGLVRIYLGFHYPSDVIVGTLIGIVVAAAANLGVMRRPAGRLIDALIRRAPGLFYAGAFAVTLELALVFDDLRDGARAFVRLLRHYGLRLGDDIGLFALGLVALLMLIVIALWGYRWASAQRR